MKVPFVDLYAQYTTIQTDIDNAIKNVISDTAFIGGKYVWEFEENYAELYGVKHCIGVANGTDAIYIALKMLEVGPGDEVITVANSWISTSETIGQTGATPVFVDIEPDYYTIDVTKIEEKITDRTKAIIPVHLYGHPANMDPILDLCKKYELKIIEDCAQAHFAEYKGKRVGTIGDIATFSFYPGKNLGAYGDAGCIITNDDALAEKCRRFANHGALVKHKHTIEGINSRLDGLQAAILNAKLPHILDWTEARRNVANQYCELLESANHVVLPKEAEYAKHVYHLFVIRSKNRDEIKAFLEENGVGTAIHYPTPLPLLDAYSQYGYKGDNIPIANEYSKMILSIPMYPELGLPDQYFVSEGIRKCC
ncbi:DegT/DnrJ/EryC1/StrS family aminotransferase [Ekhidna sp. MALMAid0563]|uniref:DegT/DnrJ/EryC1/StrS family aminotransferase n=1 Tax=Ekhidna sp. MALMAid0563 TaxID=3143937 RepID=UPI0032DEF77B